MCGWTRRPRQFAAHRRGRPLRIASFLLDAVGQLGDVVENVTLFRHLLGDLLIGMHHRGVVTTCLLYTSPSPRD